MTRSNGDRRMGRSVVLLDAQANVSIFRDPSLLIDIVATNNDDLTYGIAGTGLRTFSSGVLPGFGGLRVGLNTTAQANILCQDDVEKLFPITFTQGVSMVVHTHVDDVVFGKDHNRLYSANFSGWKDRVAAADCSDSSSRARDVDSDDDDSDDDSDDDRVGDDGGYDTDGSMPGLIDGSASDDDNFEEEHRAPTSQLSLRQAYSTVGKMSDTAAYIPTACEEADLLTKPAKIQKEEHLSDDDMPGLISDSDWEFGEDLDEDYEVKPHAAKRAFATVSELKGNYTAREIRDAEKAMEFIKCLAHMSEAEVVALVESNNLTGCDVTAADVRRAFIIYGGDVSAIKGKTVRKQPHNNHRVVDNAERPRPTSQVMYSDVFFFRNKGFLASVVSPLELVLVTPIDNEKVQTLGAALESQFAILRTKGFVIRELHVDPHQSLVRLVNQLPGVTVIVVGAGDHVGKVERKIRSIKDRIRSVVADLAFKLPGKLVKDVVMYAVNRINLQPYSGGGHHGLSPRVLFTGRKVDVKKELCMSFGTYVEAYDPKVRSNDPSAMRTESAIALYPTGNDNGSWVMLTLNSGHYITRSQFVVLPMTDLVIARLNQLATRGADREDRDDPSMPPLVMPIDVFPTAAAAVNTESATTDAVPGSATEDAVPDRDGGADHGARRSGREINPDKFMAANYNFHMSLRKGIKEHGKTALEAVVAELKQLVGKGTFFPVRRSSLSREQSQRLIRSSLFLKEKFDAAGKFDKLKARLVANGAQQDRELFDDVSSPTVSLSSLLTMLTVAAHEGRSATCFDVGNAYLNADMVGEEVIMVIDKNLTAILQRVAPSVIPFVNDNGDLCVRLTKALYGCVQSAKLWYDRLSAVLLANGYVANDVDSCVFNKMMSDGAQSTLLIYVDDILCLSVSSLAARDVEELLLREFKEIKKHSGTKLSYLGMLVDFSVPGQVSLDMCAYLKDVLEECEVIGRAATPATEELFDIDVDSPVLPEDARQLLHTRVAKLLYLSKRARPDVQLPVGFLCTRVTKATQQDSKKLNRVLCYLNGTPELYLTLRCDGELLLRGFIDASFGVHADGKSHTGVVITLGSGPILTKSSKQKIVTKSSTEAELVALTDSVPLINTIRNFIIAQGYVIPAAQVFQDNMGTIAIVTHRTPVHRTRYFRIRYFYLLEQIESGEIVITYLPTLEMVADILTKPLQGRLFVNLRRVLLFMV